MTTGTPLLGAGVRDPRGHRLGQYTGSVRRRNAVLLVIATAVVGTSAWLALRPSPEDLMADFVAELRARGEPVTIADMELPLPPDAENGADDLAAAFRWVETRLAQEDRELESTDRVYWWWHYAGPWDHDADDPWHEHATPEKLDELREFLATMGPLYEGLAAAAGNPEIVWPLPVEAASPSLFGPKATDTLDTWRDVRRLLEARAVVATDPGERLDAVVWLVALVRSVRLRTHADFLFATVFRRQSCVALRDGVEAGRLDPAELRARVDDLLREGLVATMPRALRAERVLWIEQFPALLDGSLQAQLRELTRSLDRGFNERPPPRAWEPITDAAYETLAGVRFDGPEYVAALRTIDALIPHEGAWSRADEAAFAAFESQPGYFQGHGTPERADRMRSVDAAEALARIALAACEHRANHGDWPRSTADLSPLFADGVPVNPYTDAPFVMKRDGAALVLRATRGQAPALPADESLRDAGLEWRLTPR